jgi:hypothetical protein
MRRLPMLALAAATLCLAGCDTVSDLLGEDDDVLDSSGVTQAALAGRILSFTPDVPAGGIPNWEYQFNAGSVRACNMEAEYQSTGWSVVDDRTVRVNFGSDWEQYRLVDRGGSLADGNLHGRFEYSSSPGVSMVGSFVQMPSLNWC